MTTDNDKILASMRRLRGSLNLEWDRRVQIIEPLNIGSDRLCSRLSRFFVRRWTGWLTHWITGSVLTFLRKLCEGEEANLIAEAFLLKCFSAEWMIREALCNEHRQFGMFATHTSMYTRLYGVGCKPIPLLRFPTIYHLEMRWGKGVNLVSHWFTRFNLPFCYLPFMPHIPLQQRTPQVVRCAYLSVQIPALCDFHHLGSAIISNPRIWITSR